jgi:eukaryotic-like serine/threonine-protein kinase
VNRDRLGCVSLSAAPQRQRFGRYILCDEIASGGMATVYFGRLVAPVGFSRTVALKRLHAAYAKDPEFVAMLVDEARLASRVQHRNVVQVLDVVSVEGELLLVLEYVQGVPLARLVLQARRTGAPPPPEMASAILSDVLAGLHAAHEARSEVGEPLELVHRDISPQNILIHENGSALVTDFGIARAVGRSQVTREGQTKGKPGYMAPEQIRGEPVTRRTDIFAAGVVLWEVFTGHRLFTAPNDLAIARKVLMGRVDPPSRVWPGIPTEVDEIALRALAQSPADRFESAAEMQRALERAVPPASRSAVAAWVSCLASDYLAERAQQVLRIESEPIYDSPPHDSPPRSLAASSSRTPSATVQAATPPGRLLDESADPTGVTSPPRPARSQSRAILLGAALAGGLVGVIAGGRIWFMPAATDDPSSQAATPQGNGAETSASAEPSGASVPSAAAKTTAPPEPTITPSVRGATPPPRASSAAPTGTSLATSSRAPRPPAAKDNCNPPSYVDARGITVFKTQCLTKR